jgi:hypothetical protein
MRQVCRNPERLSFLIWSRSGAGMGRMVASNVGAKDWTNAKMRQLVEGLLPKG